MYKANGYTYQFYSGEGAAHDVALPDTVYHYAKSFIKEIFVKIQLQKNFIVLGKGNVRLETKENYL